MPAYSTLPGRAANILLPLYERHGGRLPGLAGTLGAVLLAWTAARLIWALVPLPANATWRPAPPAPAAAAARSAQAGDLNTLLAARLFGDYRAPALGAAAVANAPDTHLDLTLIGILAGTRERDSRALIASGPNHDEAPYAVGDDVTRGVQLQAIFPDRVILSRNGQLETLRLDRDAGGAPPPAGMASAGEEPAGDNGADLSLAQVRDQVLKDPNKASEYIRVQPATVGGQLKGYRVYPGRNRNAFNSSGLRPGDLVTSVNGVELNDAGRALQLLGDLSQASQATVTVDRGGQTQTLSLSIN